MSAGSHINKNKKPCLTQTSKTKNKNGGLKSSAFKIKLTLTMLFLIKTVQCGLSKGDICKSAKLMLM